jgi:exonuclease-1
LTKLDQYGNCIEINQADFCACREISLAGWTEKEFRQMAILSGCDYLASIPNMGLKTAHRMIRKYKTVEKILRMLQFDGKYHVPKDYLDLFYQAELTFLHQRVFCPIEDKVVFHTEPEQPIDENKLTFVGALVEADIARKVATGELNPMTKMPIIMDQRKIIDTPRTPWTVSKSQPRMSATSKDLKKGVSIDQFFKAKRTPLAELDINCFTPSPSQQDALRRNTGPWTAIPAPRPYLNRSTTEPELPAPRSAPARPHTGRSLSSNFTSERRPQKRARLCSDDLTAGSPVAGLNLGRSRFFESTPEMSPSIGRSTKNQKQKKDDLHIYSDDSIEDAMLSLPDFEGFKHNASEKIAVFKEDTAIVTSRSVTPDSGSIASICDPRFSTKSTDNSTSQISTHSTPTVTGFTSVPSLTQSTSFGSSDDFPPTPVSAVSTTTTTTATSLTTKYAFTPKTHFSTLSRNNSGLPTPPSSNKISRIPIPVKPHSTLTNSAPIRSVSAPPQSLSAKALKHSNSTAAPATPSHTPTTTPSTHRNISSFARQPKPKPAGLGGLPFPEVRSLKPRMRKTSSLKIVMEPENVPLPEQNENEIKVLRSSPRRESEHKGYGSEDLIIRDSEGEDDEDEEVRSPFNRVSLGRFAFRG